MLERMVEADDLAATIKAAEAQLAAEQKTIDADRKKCTGRARRAAAVARRADRRARHARRRAIDKRVLAIYEQPPRKRQGIAVAEARDGICTDLPRPAAPADVQRSPPQRQHRPVRELPADPLLRARARSRRSPRDVPAVARDHGLHRRWRARQPRPRRLRRAIEDADGTVVEEICTAASASRPTTSPNTRPARGAALGEAHGHRPCTRGRLAAAGRADARRLQSEASRPAAAARQGAPARVESATVTFEHVAASSTQEADRLSNLGMDEAEAALRPGH